MFEIKVEADKCICAGHCVVEAPQLFDQSEEDGTVILIEAHPPEPLHSAARAAARLCPALAIQILQHQVERTP